MTLKKRLIICLSAVLACLLFACGGGEGGKEDPVHIGVSGVELSETSYSMVVGDSLLLKAVITPSDATDQTVNWDSSEESVAVVSSSGLVSAVGKGTCVITASVDGKSARCTITVQDKTIAVESIVLSEDTLLLGIDDTATLIATIRPENATEREITWTSSNPEIATVSDQGAKGIDIFLFLLRCHLRFHRSVKKEQDKKTAHGVEYRCVTSFFHSSLLLPRFMALSYHHTYKMANVLSCGKLLFRVLSHAPKTFAGPPKKKAVPLSIWKRNGLLRVEKICWLKRTILFVRLRSSKSRTTDKNWFHLWLALM